MFQNDYRREMDGLRPSPAAVERLNRLLDHETITRNHQCRSMWHLLKKVHHFSRLFQESQIQQGIAGRLRKVSI